MNNPLIDPARIPVPPASSDPLAVQRQIARELDVDPVFDAEQQIARRIAFLAQYLMGAGRQCYVLGISGGVDSLVAGLLAQAAVRRVRSQGGNARFIAMRLPYGKQADEADAQLSLETIDADEVLTVDIQPAADAMRAALVQTNFRDAAHEDFVLGNIKARQRMIAQYAVAGAYDGLVIGTDQAAEALMGFFTKHGDGAADVVPLNGLPKRHVQAMAKALGAPMSLAYKVPTADLETLRPQLPDETAFGVTYAEIDDFLEGKPVSAAAFEIVLRTYHASAHKRGLAAKPPVHEHSLSGKPARSLPPHG
ncbi:ammonia-dependent NAD(+) synthetase [Pigmentiphaga aceris]|uniref:NH(3)-dependent NAD(+) synthetase n=1 Tax=Pigmentiphaga aceris TaxID=1940612 RepID=A0A5C0B460_9BURK|nr:ammonia-dependent NAD(+) synthetase [Pigmentiphaga aceris]QEI08646.1 ammonia-dependent NAD(+) synthetase [Pigmentiphaga aceris]